MVNILSVDVEDWFQVEAQTEAIKFADWHNFKTRVLPNVLSLLGTFDRYGVRGTFFILGWVAEKLPDLVDHIAARGHEIASHGYAHCLAGTQSEKEFAADVRRSLEVIRKSVDVPIHGYRAPSFSLGEHTPHAWNILKDLGFDYDSSVFPIHHDTYGSPDLPRFPFRFVLEDGREIDEVPLTTMRIAGYNFPAAGGGYLRLFPYWYTGRAIRAVNRTGHPAIVYVHPWEIDTHQPRTKLSLLRRFRHYTNLGTTEYKLERLLSEFQFGTMWDYLQQSDAADRPRLPISQLTKAKPLPPSQSVKVPLSPDKSDPAKN
jgi:polysaccharide deacetylase family protein (PEP-CTERM system associated)